MKLSLGWAMLAMGLGACGYLAVSAHADESDQRTTLTFNQPVAVPGHVLLAGNYVFQMANPQGDRSIVSIFFEDKKGMDHLVTITFAVPAYREDVSDEPEVNFEESPSGAPETVYSWFYPGVHDGWQFVYSNIRPAQQVSSTTQTGARLDLQDAAVSALEEHFGPQKRPGRSGWRCGASSTTSPSGLLPAFVPECALHWN